MVRLSLALLPLTAVLLLGAACSRAPKDSDLPDDINQSLQPAFIAAFGADAPDKTITDGDKAMLKASYAPAAIARIADNEVALASLAAPSDGTCNACMWTVAVHYLIAKDNRFTVVGSYFSLVPKGPLDDPPHIRMRSDLFDHPALEAESPRRDRGCEMSVVSLYELTPDGPKLRAREVPTERNNIPMGALRTGPQTDLYGNVIADKKGKAFKVHYHGTTEGDVVWTPGADGVFTPTGGIPLPGC